MVSARPRSWTAIRRTVLVVGLLAVAVALLARDAWLAALLSPDGEITEVVYLYVLRAAVVAGGAALAVAALRASQATLQNGALAVAAFSVAFVGFEIALRVGAWVTSTAHANTPTGLRASAHPDLIYENSPSFVENGELKFNSLSMRDDERAFDPSLPKIVVVGDSIEAWRDIAPRDLYPRRLESLLNDRPGRPRLQVVNLAVTGYSLHQKVLMLKYRGLEWKPRAMVVGYCLNDPIPAGELLAYFRNDSPRRFELASLSFVNARVRLLMNRVGLDFYRQIHLPEGESWRGVLADLRRLSELKREHGVPVVVVLFPLMTDTALQYPWLDIHTRLAQAARGEGLDFIDLLDVYAAAGLKNVRADNVHPNELGHELAARELFKAMTNEKSDLGAPLRLQTH